jgi:PKD repeat protein
VVLFDATLSIDTASDVASLTYGWNFGDRGGWTGFSAINRTISHEFASDGRYNVSLVVKDQWGSESALTQEMVLVDRTSPLVVMGSTGSNASAGQAIVVSVKVTDQFGIKNVTLVYRVNNGDETSITMTPMNEPDTFYAQIPAQATDTNVSYRITAVDTNNNPYSTQTYVLNIEAASSLGISLEYLGVLMVVAIIAALLVLLIYRALVPVDEVFIIFQDGQLMAHQTRRIKPGMDDDILASMFVAIQMFVKDSFKDESSTALNRLDFGNKKILVEKGESFYLAVVLHSDRTGSVPKRMRTVIEDIQMNFGPALKAWDGDLEKVRGVKDSVGPLVNHRGPFGNK